ncbi:MAG: helix-turn-helix domain-containing protein [Candidatus Thiodiazotropha taylori]
MGKEENIFIPSRIKEERLRLDLTQDEVANHCQTTVQTVRRWEKRPIIPAEKLSFLISIGFDIQYVIAGVRSMNLAKVRDQFSGIPPELMLKDASVDRVYKDLAQPKVSKNTRTLNEEQIQLLDTWYHVPARARQVVLDLMNELIPHTVFDGQDEIEFLDPDRVHDMTQEELDAHHEKRRAYLKSISPATKARRKRIKAAQAKKAQKEKEKV